MSEHPILFSAEMVREILAGRKSQTRRVIKNVPGYIDYFAQRGGDYGAWRGYMTPGEPTDFVISLPEKPGDVLWVRESMRLNVDHNTGLTTATWLADLTPVIGDEAHMWNGRATWEKLPYTCDVVPSIFMPRWASRLRLAVTEVRIEQLQDISESDMIAEGIEPDMVDSGGQAPDGQWIDVPDYRMAFMSLWDGLNLKRGYGWESNPFVKVIGFEWMTS